MIPRWFRSHNKDRAQAEAGDRRRCEEAAQKAEERWVELFMDSIRWMTAEGMSQADLKRVVNNAEFLANIALDRMQERWPK